MQFDIDGKYYKTTKQKREMRSYHFLSFDEKKYFDGIDNYPHGNVLEDIIIHEDTIYQGYESFRILVLHRKNVFDYWKVETSDQPFDLPIVFFPKSERQFQDEDIVCRLGKDVISTVYNSSISFAMVKNWAEFIVIRNFKSDSFLTIIEKYLEEFNIIKTIIS